MKYFNYILIILGAIIAIYSKAGANQNQYVLIGGIVLLMVGVYRISRNIPSKNADEIDEDNTNNKED
ncbi:hypothetical protein FEZ18_12010 [Oceanihabitans sp. IOP_32]|uniref:hypothetical protein n=1 Tax=Oceanihabitans sp. IOP_32 TaxID=2529032 RepID=UPI001293ED54|nr:hypothetical protein [Oceanihabitans sp. IOP_32]QFZ55477.1 hypothetical protein FEZ18_12010 [Oceanihabitans sp. IOP_32]